MIESENFEFTNSFLYMFDKLVINGKEYDPTYVESLITRKNFYNHRFPIKVISLSLPSDVLYELASSVQISRPVVEVEYVLKIILNEKNGGPGKTYEKGKYIGLLDESYVNYDPDLNLDGNIQDFESTYGDETKVRIGLFDEKDLNSFKSGYINNVYKNFNLATLITKAYQECVNGGMPLYFSPPDNEQIYRQELVTPMGFFDFMNYVDTEMGIYDTGYNIFLQNGETFILSKNNTHNLQPIGWLEPLYVNKIFVDPPHDLSPTIGSDVSSGFPSKIFKIKYNEINNIMETQNFGRYEEFYADIHNMYFTDAQSNYNNITDTKIVSNRFTKHKKRKYGVQNFMINLDNLPFKANPFDYVDLIGEGEGMNNDRYRVADYLNVISGKNSYTKVNIKRLTNLM